MYSSMIFSKFANLCNHHYNPILKHSITPKKNLMPICSLRDFQKSKGGGVNLIITLLTQNHQTVSVVDLLRPSHSNFHPCSNASIVTEPS